MDLNETKERPETPAHILLAADKMRRLQLWKVQADMLTRYVELISVIVQLGRP